MALLQVENLAKSFGSTEVLKGINFEVNKGDVVAIIGSSGSGKTTLLRCLNFLEKADTGKIILNDEVLYDGEDKSTVSENAIRQKRLHFGLVFQSFNLFPQYNVMTNLLIAPTVLGKGEFSEKKRRLKKKYFKAIFDKKIKADCIKELKEIKESQHVFKANLQNNAEKLLERVGLSDKKKSYPCQLSGGQCQRVAIARALAMSPDILCFDEPTSALDPELTGEVLKVIKGLKGAENTMIIVTHEMEFARNVADKVIFMADGVIEEVGTPEEVFGNPKSPKTYAFLNKSLENTGV